MKFYSLSLAACLLASQNLYANSAQPLSIDSVSTSDAQWFFHNLKAEKTDNTVMVRGRIKPGSGVLSTVSGHVDITIYDADGKLLAETTAEYFPNNVRRAMQKNGAAFEARLNASAPFGSTVKVAFHRNQQTTTSPPSHDKNIAH